MCAVLHGGVIMCAVLHGGCNMDFLKKTAGNLHEIEYLVFHNYFVFFDVCHQLSRNCLRFCSTGIQLRFRQGSCCLIRGILCIVLGRSLFVFLCFFFFSSLCSQSFIDLRILIIPLVTSNFYNYLHTRRISKYVFFLYTFIVQQI